MPRGDTILHIVHRNGELLEELLQRAHDNPDDRRKIKIHIPLIQNIYGMSPIHLQAKHQEYRYINVLLEYLSAYPIDHHSRAIKDCLPMMVE